MRRVLQIAALLVAGASCAPWWSPQLARPFDPIKVPHDVHKRAKVDCLTCHESIYDAKSLDGDFLPKEQTCLQCHRAEKEKGNCAFCHTNVKQAGPWPRLESALRVSHADHIDRVKEDCSVCHKKLPAPLRSVDDRPTMAACTSCHEHKQDYENGNCTKCHLDLKRYPLVPISLFSHRGDFVREHARPARANAATCAECHEQTFCGDCHAKTVAFKVETKFPEKVEAYFIHRDDWLGRHSVEARADESSCARCHGQSFCAECHRAQNLTPDATAPRDPHPSGWAIPGSPEFLGEAARRDIASCASCHDQGAKSNCVQCHAEGGPGGNPHPPGWNHSRGEIAQNNMCRICHH